jgi:hypothetical protein
MAKITAYIPEPTPIFTPDNQRQIIQALTTIKDQLNTSFQQDLRNEQLAFTEHQDQVVLVELILIQQL